MTHRTMAEVKIEQYEKWLAQRDADILELENKLRRLQIEYDELWKRHHEEVEALTNRIHELQAF